MSGGKPTGGCGHAAPARRAHRAAVVPGSGTDAGPDVGTDGQTGGMDPAPAAGRRSRFHDLADGGRALAPLVVAAGPYDDPVVLAVMPNGLPAGREVAAALGREAVPLVVARDDDGVRVQLPPGLTDRVVVVVDDGVETGTAALAIGGALREVGVARAVLAVPVCPREAQAGLALRYDDIVAAVRPLVRRDLRWHYVTLG